MQHQILIWTFIEYKINIKLIKLPYYKYREKNPMNFWAIVIMFNKYKYYLSNKMAICQSNMMIKITQ